MAAWIPIERPLAVAAEEEADGLDALFGGLTAAKRATRATRPPPPKEKIQVFSF